MTGITGHHKLSKKLKVPLAHSDESTEMKPAELIAKIKGNKAIQKIVSNKRLLWGLGGGGTVLIVLGIGMLFGQKMASRSLKNMSAQVTSHDSHHPAQGHLGETHERKPAGHGEAHDSKSAGHEESHGQKTAEHRDAHERKPAGHAGSEEDEAHGSSHPDGDKHESSGHDSAKHDSSDHDSANHDSSGHDSAKHDSGHGVTPAKGVPSPQSFFGKYKQAAREFQEKLDELRRADEENEKLTLENANLRLRVEALQFDCRAEEAGKRSQELGLKLDKETGSRLGRTLASIPYKIPAGVFPYQLYPLAVSYFKAREDEKAAVILTFLTGLEKDSTFRNARNLLMAGVAWYRLDNFVAANGYFDQVLRTVEEKPDAQSRQVQEQVRLWKALTSERMGKHTESQDWLRELLNYNPHSTEAAWVNSREASRVHVSGD